MCIEVLPLISGWHINFVDKSVICVDVVYLKYFIDLMVIHEYNCGCLFRLHVIKTGIGLSLEDKADDRKMLLMLIYSY